MQSNNKCITMISYTVDELTNIVQSYSFSKLDNSHLGKYTYRNVQDKPLPGEVFRLYSNSNLSLANDREAIDKILKKGKKIMVSNKGRIQIDNTIKDQFQKDYGYLFVELENKTNYPVYRLVAETWNECPVNNTNNHEKDNPWVVHHISNNGFDNRPENLIWMTSKMHGSIIHNAALKNEEIRMNIIGKLNGINDDEVEFDTVLEYLEDIHAFKQMPDNSLVSKIVKIYNIDKKKYQNINWK